MGGGESEDTFKPISKALELASARDRLYYLEVSDSNTTGMDYERGNNKTKFHGFLHSTGASNKKSANSGGSFGIGKAAYFAMSPLRSIFVSTMTEDANHNKNYVFQGVSMLCTHRMDDGYLRMPTGFYSSNNEHPITSVDKIPNQFVREETGTSICILGIQVKSQDDKNKIFEEIKLAVLRNFWLAICNDKLTVTVGNEEISSQNIDNLVENNFEDIADNGRKNINPRPYLELYRKAKTDDKKYILIEKRLPHLGDVRLYIYRHPEGRGRILYFRMPNMLVKREKLSSSNNFFAIFICDDSEGDKKLKKLETVAHDDWRADNWKPREVGGGISNEAKAIVDEYESFIRDSIDEAFGANHQETMEIVGLDRYLYIPTASDNDMLMSDSEAPMSEPTGGFKEEGVSPTTTHNGEFQIVENKFKDKSAKGKVYIGVTTSASISDNGPLHSGKGKHNKTSSSPQHIIPGIQRTNIEDENGLEGHFAREIDVEYRGIAQKEGGKYYHYLIITSPEDVENGRVDVETGREYGSSERLIIIESDKGKPNKNSICGLTLQKGSNKIRIRFADNLSHTITLKAYEDK